MGAPDTALQAGDLIDGRYRVNYLLGEGGMATVWAGTNERTGKRVALKVIRQDLTNTPGAELLFQLEGLAASRVNHPNVVTIFDVVEHKSGACIVMELLDGEHLGSYIARNGPLGVSEATALLVPAMRGVAAAHAQGVIHRDLKPGNIFICIGPDGRAVATKVLDFGISTMVERAREHAVGDLPPLAGTPAYMSPEQIESDAESDGRTDVYGFGVVLYEALAGETPFPGEPTSDLLRRILHEPPPSLALLRPELPSGLVSIIEKAMAKAPGDRFPNMNAMVSAIEDELMPATLPPRSSTPRTGTPASVMSYPGSGPAPAVRGPAAREPSGEHQGTMFLFGRTMEGDNQEGVPNQVILKDGDDWDHRVKAMASLLPPPAASRALVALPAPAVGQAAIDTAPLDIGKSPFRLRWQTLAGAAMVVALVLVVWMVMPSPSAGESSTSLSIAKATAAARAAAAQPAPPATAAQPAAPPTATEPATVVHPVLEIAPLEASPPLAMPDLLAASKSSAPAGNLSAARGAGAASRSRLAMREGSAAAPARRAGARGKASAEKPVAKAAAVVKVVAPSKAGGSVRPSVPRAGGLSTEDF